MRVLVCGSRIFNDYGCIYRNLATLSMGRDAKDVVIIHGDARGADSIAGYAAAQLGYTVEVYPPDWEKDGRGAGIIRNQRMLDRGKPEICIAFYYGAYPTRGTGDMMMRARKANLLVLTPTCVTKPPAEASI